MPSLHDPQSPRDSVERIPVKGRQTLTPTRPFCAFLYFIRLGANTLLHRTCPILAHGVLSIGCANAASVTREDEANDDGRRTAPRGDFSAVNMFAGSFCSALSCLRLGGWARRDVFVADVAIVVMWVDTPKVDLKSRCTSQS